MVVTTRYYRSQQPLTQIHFSTQLASAASIPEPFNTERECGVAALNAVQQSVLVFYKRVEARLYALKGTYDQCRQLPATDAAPCLRNLVANAKTVIQGLRPELDAKIVILRQYGLERLEEYFVCRNPNNEPTFDTYTPQSLCGLRTLEEVEDALEPYTSLLRSNLESLVPRYYACLETAEDLQATCFARFFRYTTAAGREVYEKVKARQAEILEGALAILENYNTCRNE